MANKHLDGLLKEAQNGSELEQGLAEIVQGQRRTIAKQKEALRYFKELARILNRHIERTGDE